MNVIKLAPKMGILYSKIVVYDLCRAYVERIVFFYNIGFKFNLKDVL